MNWDESRPLWKLPGLGILLIALSGPALAAPPPDRPGANQGRPAFPQLELAEESFGEEAIGLLGNKLPDVAAYYGMTTAQFASLLRRDSTARIDRSGRLLYVDDFPEPAEEPATSDPLQSAPFPHTETFSLHSRPGASRVIYLDFDGHVTEGTAWNNSSGQATIISPPYNREGDASTFSALEHEYIQKVWRQVAEDYAPFDVDVTTEDPGDEAIFRRDAGDQQFGTRVVITENNFYDCSCGGVAYVGVFDRISSSSPQYYQPAWVFNTSLVGVGEASTHEAGHNLGLSHDGASGTSYYQGHGSGPTGWAPIMGAGYYKDLVQWSQGEYDGANNSQDDLAVIASYGAPAVADDHGDTRGTASTLELSTNGTTASLSGAGLIGTRADIDVFTFVSGAGAYSINVNPAPFSPNLDIAIALYDGADQLVDSDNPASSLPASLSGSLAAGEYYLEIEGVGKDDPLLTGYTDYASLGRYSVTASIADASGLVPPVAIAAASPMSGVEPLYVAFDGAASIDPDGADGSLADISSFRWDFGGGDQEFGSETNRTLSAGSHVVTLTVTDRDGLSDMDSVTIDVLPEYLEQMAIGQITGAGSVSGSYTATHTDGGGEQSIMERVSGGRKSSRYSYLEHTWIFSIAAGEEVELQLTGHHDATNENETMRFSYAVAPNLGDDDYQALTGISLGAASASVAARLPASVAGEVRVRVQDTDDTPGNIQLDSVVIDRMVIVTRNGNVPEPVFQPASGLSATAVSSSQIDLSWTHDAAGGAAESFNVERSADGTNGWQVTGSVPGLSFSDGDVLPGGTYYYRVQAVKTGESVPASAVVSATTPDGTMQVELTANGYKDKGVKYADLSWSGFDTQGGGMISVSRDGVIQDGAVPMSATDWSESLGKGGGTYRYQVCSAGICSNEAVVVF